MLSGISGPFFVPRTAMPYAPTPCGKFADDSVSVPVRPCSVNWLAVGVEVEVRERLGTARSMSDTIRMPPSARPP